MADPSQAGKRHARLRIDEALVARGLSPSREKAKRAIMANEVRINGHPVHKPGVLVGTDDSIEVLGEERFVSRGGLKLQHALEFYGISVTSVRALDIGASTGGFTDCLLQNGAAAVCAIDVGHGQLAWKLRQDPRVKVMEKTNARTLVPEMLPVEFRQADLAVIDCSFISLRTVLPPVVALLRPLGRIIALLKPQFEAGKAEADKGAGVIRDPEVHRRVIRELEEFVGKQASLRWHGVTESPILGPAGNKEFLVLIEKPS